MIRLMPILAIALVLVVLSRARATVFINEAFINPPTDLDSTREFVELLGTPGKKLDGYAIAVLDGTREKLYPLGSIPPIPVPSPEIDELFSLDGLTLGRNGILVLGVYTGTTFYYPALLSDSNFSQWTNLWNGGLDTPGTINNDGSTTFILVRNRPGQTEADPGDPNGLRWGKEIHPDAQLITPVWDPKDESNKDQWGDGSLDEGEPNGLGGNTLDMVGVTTGSDITDDLEVVDEVSFEDRYGWEYDVDGRHVDSGSSVGGLPHRHVHALDDPAGFNPDVISRVDYRTKGIGWRPAEDGTGEMANGNNWQDTATEQWVRGESTTGNVPDEDNRFGFFYDNTSNSDPNAVQPYDTHVPLWLDDGNSPDYDFGSATYEIAAGRINHLAVPFIPGDCDRDGCCDVNDILKIKAVFGADDWIFSNGFQGSPQGNSNDPATQTRPWDLDATGDNGIEASDLQWTLNFQVDTTGQIVAVQYDSPTPAATGVYLNSNTDVECTLTTAVNIPSGRNLDTLPVGDIVEITVRGQVTAGPNTTSDQENGIMQYAHDVEISTAGVMEVNSIEALGPFSKTRASLESPQGTSGDLGVQLVNGYTTSFTAGLTGPAELYRITLQAVDLGSVDVNILPASAANFADSTPTGLKIGHTDNNGDPNSSLYPNPVAITVVPAGDLTGDGAVDYNDLDVIHDNWLKNDPNTAVVRSYEGHWKMNDDAGNTIVADSSGQGNDGTAQRNTNLLHTGGKINGALTFDGTTDYIDLGDVIGTGAYTKVAWIKRAAGNYFNNIISSDTASHAFFAPYTSFRLIAGHNGTWDLVQDSTGLSVDTWYHVALSFDPGVDSGRMVLYKNGAPVSAATSVPTQSGSTTTYIGKYSTDSNDYNFAGAMDNVMVFDRALTEDEIQLLYNDETGTESLAEKKIEGDMNKDAIVNLLDYDLFARDWGK